MKKRIEDTEALYQNMKITAQEQQALAIEKKIYAMAQKQMGKKLEDTEYQLPDF